jgi:signal transduction histidine kinase
VRALITRVVSDLDRAAKDKHQTIRIDVAPDACSLVGDTAKLHDILQNLIENAIAYTPEGGTIEVGAALAGGRYLLTVADNGPGIPHESLTRVFERFYRVDKSRARPGGTGLGLSIVKNLANVLQGDVFVANRETGGALFTVKLPIRDAPEERSS